MKDVAVVIVSYNVRQLLGECLASVLASQGVSHAIWVVDNASADGSADLVASRFPQVRLIRSATNGGYAYANNLAMRETGVGVTATGSQQSDYRYVLLLNPDTRLAPGDLAACIDYLDAHPDVAVLGPKLVRQDGSLDLACRRSFPTPAVSFYRMIGLSKLIPRSRRFARYNLTYLDPDETAEVDSVVGAFMLVRATAIREVGLLDEAFFMYGEDIDWALRMKQAGWRVVYYPQVVVLHYKGESSRQLRRRTTIEFYRSMLIFYRKHYARSTFFLLHWLIVGGIVLRGGLAYLQHLLTPAGLNRAAVAPGDRAGSTQ